MHTNYYFFRQLAKVLQVKLEDSILEAAFSQAKNELVLGFSTNKQDFWIKILLLADTTLLSFPPDFKRAKKNSIDLFEILIGKKLEGVQTFEQERLLVLNFENDYQLVVQAFGKDNNIILFQKGIVVHSFKKSINDLALTKLIRPTLPSTLEYFERFGYRKIFPSLAAIKPKNWSEDWELIQKLLKYLEKSEYFIFKETDKIVLTLFEPAECLFKTTDILAACSYFFKTYLYQSKLQAEKKKQLKTLKRQFEKTNSYLKSNRSKLKDLEKVSEYRMMGDLLLSNLNQIEPYSKTTTLFNFYTNQKVTVKLNPKLSPAENADRYYRKVKNQNIAKNKLRENIKHKLQELERLKFALQKLETVKDLKTLQNQSTKSSVKSVQRQPYKEVIFQNFRIWIGKSAQDNDMLLNRYSHKNDMWLHAKDAKGSHVIIKGAGTIYPKPVLEEAGSWAASYSDRKHESLAPVSYTLRKYVRKRKGLALGQVVLEREQVIMVKPKFQG